MGRRTNNATTATETPNRSSHQRMVSGQILPANKLENVRRRAERLCGENEIDFMTPETTTEETSVQTEKAQPSSAPASGSVALLAQDGTFYCTCGAKHSRGPWNGSDVYRCLRCGKSFRMRGLAALR